MSEHAAFVSTAESVFPGARVVDQYDYPEFRRRCLALMSETIPTKWPDDQRLDCALRGLAVLVERLHGAARDFAIQLFDELGGMKCA